MVKIHNVFGDTWIGKYHDKIYQRVHGQQVRREGFKRPYPMSPVQELQKQKFQEFTEWWRSQTREDKETIKEQFKEEGIEQKDPKYPTAYHYLLGLGLTPINIKLIDSETATYLIEHPCIYKVEEVDSEGNIIQTHNNLSNPYTFDFTSQYTFIPTAYTDSIIVYTPFNHYEKFKLSIVPHYTGVEYELITALTFTSQTTEFTVSNLSDYYNLYMIYNLYLLSGGVNNAVYIFPNGDTGANYTNVQLVPSFYYFPRHDYYRDTPEAKMVLCRCNFTYDSLLNGTAMMNTKKSDYWRSCFSRFGQFCSTSAFSQFYYISYWKDTTSTISSLLFKTMRSYDGFVGYFRLYGIKS